MTQSTELSTEQLIHRIASDKTELRTRKINERERTLLNAKECFKDTAAAAPAAASAVGSMVGKLAQNIQQFGRDFRNG